MHKKMKYLLLLPLTAIVSCGYSTSYLVEGDKYVSSHFNENYYTHWDNELNSASLATPVDVTSKSYIHQYYFYQDESSLEGFDAIDPNFIDNPPLAEDYGAQFKMGNVDDSFRYGYQSKLFDGQMVCGGQNSPRREQYAYQWGRVQINQSGFSIRFSKESSDLHYFAMQFKASTDNTKKCYPVGSLTLATSDSQLYHDSNVTLEITLYNKTLSGIEGHPFLVDVDLLGITNYGYFYTFLAFDLEEYDIVRLVGVSIEFTINSDALISFNEGKTYQEGGQTKNVDLTNDDYALFLYELFFPYTSWN